MRATLNENRMMIFPRKTSYQKDEVVEVPFKRWTVTAYASTGIYVGLASQAGFSNVRVSYGKGSVVMAFRTNELNRRQELRLAALN